MPLLFSNISLHLATLQDITLLQYWDTKPHVIASSPNDEIDWEMEVERKVSWQEILIAKIEDQPIGVVVIIDPALEDSHYWGEVEDHLRAIDIWIGEESDLGKGYGTQMMKQALARCFADPSVKAVLIDPLAINTRAHKFYEKMGFSFVEERWFDQDRCFVYKIDRQAWQKKL